MLRWRRDEKIYPYQSFGICKVTRRQDKHPAHLLQRCGLRTVCLLQAALFRLLQVWGRAPRRAPFTVRDVKPAWRSRWLRHRFLCDFPTSSLTCLHVCCSFCGAGVVKARLGAPGRAGCRGCGVVWGCSITALAAGRRWLALMRHPQPRS